MNEQHKPLKAPEVFLTIESDSYLSRNQQVQVYAKKPTKDSTAGYWYGFNPTLLSVEDCLKKYGVVPATRSEALHLARLFLGGASTCLRILRELLLVKRASERVVAKS